MSHFLENANRIFEAAGVASDWGQAATDIAILIDWEGAIRMVSGSDWPLDSLQAEHGARMAYRVSRSAGRTRVEGRSGSHSCVLEAKSPAAVSRGLLSNEARYCVAVPALLASNDQAGYPQPAPTTHDWKGYAK